MKLIIIDPRQRTVAEEDVPAMPVRIRRSLMARSKSKPNLPMETMYGPTKKVSCDRRIIGGRCTRHRWS